MRYGLYSIADFFLCHFYTKIVFMVITEKAEVDIIWEE